MWMMFKTFTTMWVILTDFKFVTQGKGDEVLLFGHKICELDWLYLGKEIEVYDAGQKKNLMLSLYQVEISGGYYVFGTNEIADNEWVFYTQQK